MAYEPQKVRYVSVNDFDSGKTIARHKYREINVDIDLIDGFVTAVVIFAKSPVRTIPRDEFQLLIEAGETAVAYAVVDYVDDVSPYRERLKLILDIADGFSLSRVSPNVIKDIFTEINKDYPSWIHFHLLQNLLAALGLSWVGFLDGHPIVHLEYITAILEKRDEILEYVVQEVCKQIDNGGISIGLNLEKAMEHREFAKRMSHIIARRQEEIANIRVNLVGNSVDLRRLWLSAYGFEILTAMKLGCHCEIYDFHQLENELLKNKMKLHKTKQAYIEYPERVSEGLRQYIWELANLNEDSTSAVISKLIIQVIEFLFESFE